MLAKPALYYNYYVLRVIRTLALLICQLISLKYERECDDYKTFNVASVKLG